MRMVISTESRLVMTVLLCLAALCGLGCRKNPTSGELLRSVTTGSPIDYRFLLPRQYLTFNSNRQYVAASDLENGAIQLHLWNTDTGSGLSLPATDDKRDYAFGTDGRTIAIESGNEIRVFNLADRSLLQSYPLPSSEQKVQYRLLTLNEQMFLVSFPYYFSPPHHAKLWRLSDQKLIQNFDLADSYDVTDVALSHNGRFAGDSLWTGHYYRPGT